MGLEVLFEEISAGLRSDPRRIPEKLFYDRRGAELFEQITRLEAYYPTRTEFGILEDCVAEVSARIGPGATLVEFGSGSGRKTNLLLDALIRPARCVAIDISEAQLVRFTDELRVEYPQMEVFPLVTDYTRPFSLPQHDESKGGGVPRRVLFFFPGSSIGNFEPDAAERFLHGVGMAGGAGGSLLIGVDLVKHGEILEAAYDDPQGVTSEFNRNALRHLNDLFGGDFNPAAFRHRAPWNASRSRIEMRLVSEIDQEVTLYPPQLDHEPVRVFFREGEEIVTEHSYKYRGAEFERLCQRAGWTLVSRWMDDRGWFAVLLLEWET